MLSTGDIQRLAFSQDESLISAVISDGIYKTYFTEQGHQTKKISDSFFYDASCLYESKNGHIWICTPGAGLLKVVAGKTESYLDRFPFRYIRGFAAIGNSHYLISTNSGLYFFDDINSNYTRIHASYGISDVDFEYNSIVSSHGKSVINGDDFTYIIDNFALKKHVKSASREINQVQLFGIEVFDHSRNTYQDIMYRITKENSSYGVKLSADESFVEIHLSIANYAENEYLKFEYRLLGFTDAWVSNDSSISKLIFSSLQHGSYTLEARVSNSLIEQPITRLRIIVLPPWWLSPTAYGVYFLVLMGVIGYCGLWLKRQFFKQGKELKGQVREKQSLLENTNHYIHHILDRKQQLFTNVTHELQAPITLISGPVRQIIENPDDEENARRLEMIEDNAKRLHFLVNQVIEIERLDSLKTLPCQSYNLNTIFPQLIGNLSALTELHGQSLEAKVRTRGEIFLLRDSLEKILLHLVTDAIKKTPPGGKINISARCEALQLVINIAHGKDADGKTTFNDTQTATIFQRIACDNDTVSDHSCNVGLILVKELVLANKGWIDIETRPQKTTSIVVYLPLVSFEQSDTTQKSVQESPISEVPEPPPTDLRPSILIVDDNTALRSYLNERLGVEYRCIEANSVKTALDLLKVVTVGVVICDLRMPNETGLQLCEQMQQVPSLQSVPFILLATSADESDLSGPLLKHIDTVLSKPVDTTRLLQLVERIILRRSSEQKQTPILHEASPFKLPEFDNARDQAFYINFLKNSVSKKLICTNPDLTVHRGSKEEYCAGSIAQIFESLGGTVEYFGKPHKEIYRMCFNSKEKVLAIGDNLRTDIKGANNCKIDSIFISNGVHRNEFKNEEELRKLLNKYKVKTKHYITYSPNDDETDETVVPVEEMVEFVVEASDVKQAEAEADDYMLNNYGQEAYSIDTDITEIN